MLEKEKYFRNSKYKSIIYQRNEQGKCTHKIIILLYIRTFD